MTTFTYNFSIEKYFQDKSHPINSYAEYNFYFILIFDFFRIMKKLYGFYKESSFLTFVTLIMRIESYIMYLLIKMVSNNLLIHQQSLSLALINKQIKNRFVSVKYATNFSNKCLYAFLHCFFFVNDWLITKQRFTLRRRLGKKYLKKKKKLYNSRLLSRLKKKKMLLNTGKLRITFTKRNMFLNLATFSNKSLLVTTLRKLGFLGRRRREYLSIYSAVRLVKQNLRKYKIQKLAIIYKGWNRFRIAVKNALKCRDRFRVPILYVKFAIKIPHNGCRLNKKKRKKRKKRVWLKKKKSYVDKRYTNINV